MPTLTRALKLGRSFQNPVETKVGGLGMLLKVLPLYLTNKEERVPRRPIGPFHTDANVYKTPPQTGLRITWMGHSSLLIEIDGLRVLIDPVWDNRASPFSWAGPKRFFPAPLPLDQLPTIDVVLISHDHYDHLGKRTIQQLNQLESTKHARWLTSLGVGNEIRSFGFSGHIDELDWTESLTITGHHTGCQLAITALPARHFSGRSFLNRFQTLWSSFVLKTDRHNIYFGADSGLWTGFAEIGRQFGPFDLVMLEVGAYNDLWKAIHMGPDGAIRAFAELGNSGVLMPIHWALFDLALHDWRQPIERITDLAAKHKIKLWSPIPGVPTDVCTGQEFISNWWRSKPQ